MDFNSYQRVAKTTAIYPATHKILYPALGLAGEAGEIGDVLWYCAVLADDLGISLGKIASENETKLQDRRKRGMISGSGDSR